MDGRAVAQKRQRRVRRQGLQKRFQRQGRVLQHTRRAAGGCVKGGAVDLTAPGVEDGTDEAGKAHGVHRQRFQRVDGAAGPVYRVGEALDHAHADAHAGKRAGAGDGGEGVHVLAAQARRAQGRVHGGQNGLRMGEPHAQRRRIGDEAIAHHRAAGHRAGSVHCQYVQSFVLHRPRFQASSARHGANAASLSGTPSVTSSTSRAPSSAARRSVRRTQGRASRSTVSGHSTRHTPAPPNHS